MTGTVKLLSLLVCFFVLASLPARSDTYCNVNTPALAFGAYDPLGSGSRDTIGTITVTCTGNTGDAVSYSLALDTTGLQGGYRTMMSAGQQLNYLVCADNGYTQVWGDGSGGSIVVSDSYRLTAHSNSPILPRVWENPRRSESSNGWRIHLQYNGHFDVLSVPLTTRSRYHKPRPRQ